MRKKTKAQSKELLHDIVSNINANIQSGKYDELIIKIEYARKDFFAFCNLMAPKFYKEDRQFLIDLCNELQDFYYSDDEVLVLNAPPRHGKTRTVSLFSDWIYGQNVEEKIMTGSYNERLSTSFSKNVRNMIQEEKADINRVVYSDIFPDVKIQHGEAAMNLWSLEGGYNSYLATSPGGTATGFGASLMIIDDLIKRSSEAYNENLLDGHWDWFTNTMLQRLEEGGKIIIIMTRWSTNDLAGRALEHYQGEGAKIRHINLKAQKDDGTMLCEEILSLKSYKRKIKAMGEDIASANYQQEPIDIKGKLYGEFKEYDPSNVPGFRGTGCYTDTADEGADFLATFIFDETFDNEAYIKDVIFTKEPMEITEILLAEKLLMHRVNNAWIESNNGGRGFARNVQRILLEKFRYNKTVIRWFHQSQNKKARILSEASWIMEHVYFPRGWQNRWPELYKALMSYQREGKNNHDDGPDGLTGVSEYMNARISNTSDISRKLRMLKRLGL